MTKQLSDLEKVARWLEDQSRIATNSLHCGDSSITISRTHAWAESLDKASAALRSAPPVVGREWERLTAVIRPMIESVCGDGNSDAARLAKEIADAILLDQGEATGSRAAEIVTPASEPEEVDGAEFDAFERATEIMAHRLAFFRDEANDTPTENDRLLAGHLAGSLWANKLLSAKTGDLQSRTFGGTNFCGHAMMASLCPECSKKSALGAEK